MFMTSKKIFVTGGAGYIGSHCVLSLLSNGYKVVIFDNLSTGHKEIIDILCQYGEIDFIHGDLNVFTNICDAFERHNDIEAVLHLAAFSQVAESMHIPAKYYRNNLCGTINLLDAMIKYHINKLVFSSTAATYGEPIYTPIDEEHPQNPINTYGKTKLMIEKIMDDYDLAYSLKSVRLRYFNVAGADHNTRIGEWHTPETHLIPNILKSVLNNTYLFNIYGTDYDTPDGTCIRDYINVEDLATAHMLSLDYLLNGGETNFFNLGTTKGCSVKEIFNICEKITKQSISLKVKPRREGDPAVLVADNTKAKKILSWTPVRNINETIESAFRWEKKLYKLINK